MTRTSTADCQHQKEKISNYLTFVSSVPSVKRRKLKWYGHVTRSSGLAKTVLQATVKEETTRQTVKTMGRQHQRVDWP